LYDLSKIQIEFLLDTVKRLEEIPDEEYFGPAYRDYISNSQLKLINPEEGGAPTRFLEGFSSDTKSSALELGSAVHQMILEKDKYFLSPVDKPSGKVGAICDRYHKYLTTSDISEYDCLVQACEDEDYYKGKMTQKKYDDVLIKGQEYLEFLKTQDKNPGVIILTEQQKEKLDGCLKSVKTNKLLMDLLFPPNFVEDDFSNKELIDILSFHEDVMIMDFKASIPSEEFDDPLFNEIIELKLKSKIDNWSINFTHKIVTLNDLKTTGKPLNTFPGITSQRTDVNGDTYTVFEKGSFQNYHYYRQFAMYLFILKKYVESAYGSIIDDTWKFNVNVIVVETNKPYLSHAFKIGNKWIKTGYDEFINLLKRVSYHKLRGFDKFVEMDFKTVTEI